MTTPEDRRRIARDAFTATRGLEKAVARGDMDAVRAALEQGAVPEWGTYPNNDQFAGTGSLVAMSLKHRSLDLLETLLQAGAPVKGHLGYSIVEVAVQAKFPEGLARLAPLFIPNDENWQEALGAGLAYFKALDDLHHLDRTRPMELAPEGFTALFHAKHADIVDYLVATGADPRAQLHPNPSDGLQGCTPPWSAGQWRIHISPGMEEEEIDDVGQSLANLDHALGWAENNEPHPLEVLQALVRRGETLNDTHFSLAAHKGYPDVLVWMLRQEPSLRVPELGASHQTPQKDSQAYYWMEKRPKLHQWLLAEQQAIDLERKTEPAAGRPGMRRM